MKPRAAKGLAGLSDRKLFVELAEGMKLLAEHSRTLEGSVATLRRAHEIRGAYPLRLLAEEEAAKFLILLDVARCPKDQRIRSRQLGRFHNHLAKGIYANVMEISPADYEEVRRYVDGLRRSHYLDGPNDLDWIYRNEVEAFREERSYVDIIESDEGRSWHSPAGWEDMDVGQWSAAIRLVGAMEKVGFATSDGLDLIARVWGGIKLEDSLHWSKIRKLNIQTIESLLQAGLAEDGDEEDASTIVELWSFPLYEIDLQPIKVDLEELRERQRNWSPDGESWGEDWGPGDWGE